MIDLSSLAREAMPEPCGWRYVPSEVWGDQVLTQDPKHVQLAREFGREVEGLITIEQAHAHALRVAALALEEAAKVADEQATTIGALIAPRIRSLIPR